MENLVVHEDNMLKNTKLYGGVIYSQKIMLKLTERGFAREDAYRLVQKYALSALNGGDFKNGLLRDSEVTAKLSESEIEECFNPKDYLQNIETIFERFEN